MEGKINMSYEIATAIDNEDTGLMQIYYREHPEYFSGFFYSANQKDALHYATRKGKLNACKCLVSLGMNIDAETVRWDTPLCEAAIEGHDEVVRYLVEAGATIDGTINTICTPLMCAITFRHEDIARFLIERGADINRIHLMTNQTPLELSRIWKMQGIELALMQKGARAKLGKTEMNTLDGTGIYLHTSKIGDILPIVLKSNETATLRLAVINKKKQKMLFSVGLFSCTNPKTELNLVLPVEWNMYDTNPKNMFPVELLWRITEQLQEDKVIDESSFISADSEAYRDLSWPDGIAGFYPADVDWGLGQSDKEMKEPVRLLSLLPVKRTKKISEPDIAKNRTAKWTKLMLNIPHKL